MYSPVLSVPACRVSGWVAETDPQYARPWLESLPLADSAEAAREIYQALYTVNRAELKVQARLELMSLYDPVVATVCKGLQSHLVHAVPPLGPKKRQLAEFIRRLHIEMAYGYKCCLRDLTRARVLLRRKSRLLNCIERALHHMSEVLLRSYLVYLPYPALTWRETHELYRLAESLNAVDDPVDSAERGTEPVTIGERYVQTLLLGLANPYQLPHSAAQQLHNFLARWAKQARVTTTLDLIDPAGLFLVDLGADAPPVPLTKKRHELGASGRILDTRLLVRTLQQFVARLEAGELLERLGLGVDCLDSACIDLLHRMSRALGESARRRFTRRQRSANVFVCIGLNAIHFFVNGQRPFTTYLSVFPWLDKPDRARDGDDVAFVELEETGAKPGGSVVTLGDALTALPAERFRVDRWQLRDVGPQGMALARYSDAVTPTRVGELIGVQQPSDLGHWRAAVIRWVKSPETNSVEVGVEVLAAAVTPVAVRSISASKACPGLLLPAAEITQRPATLIIPRGVCHVGEELELIEEGMETRRVRILRLVERTGAFEQVVYADVMRD